MARKPQKPYEQLQNKRVRRRRARVMLLPAAQLTPEALARRDAAPNVATGVIARASGRWKIRKVSEAAATPRERLNCKYRPKAEQRRTPPKARIAAARPRNARGYSLTGAGQRDLARQETPQAHGEA